jgi:glycerophosphoryl diester phosphodiesterase
MDNRIVIWHDRDPDSLEALARQSGAEGLPYVPSVPPIGSEERRPVDELTLAELRENYGYAALDGARATEAHIPELGELWSFTAENKGLRRVFLDIKLAAEDTDRAAFLVRQVFEAHPESSGMTIYFMSVEDPIAAAMEAERKRLGADRYRVIRDYESEGALEGAKALGLRDVSTGFTLTRVWHDYKEEVEDLVDARNQGQIDSVTTWTIDDPEDQEELIRLGVDGVMTNDPAALAGVYREVMAEAAE